MQKRTFQSSTSCGNVHPSIQYCRRRWWLLFSGLNVSLGKGLEKAFRGSVGGQATRGPDLGQNLRTS
jgi:hypothetical protein